MSEKVVKSKSNISEIMSHVTLGQVYKSMGQLDQAEDSFKKALVLDSNCMPALLGIALIANDRHGPVRAAQEYVRYGPKKATFGHAFTELAAAHMEQERWEEAIAVLSRGLESGVECWEMYHNLGTCLLRTDRPEEATRAYLQASKRNNDTPESMLTVAEMYLGCGKRFRARRHYSNVCRRFHGSDAYAGATLGFFQLGHFRSAIRAGSRAVLLNPEDATTQLVVGLSHVKLGQYQAAKEPLWQATWLNQGQALSLRYLALAYEETGNPKAAAWILKRMRRLNPDCAGTSLKADDQESGTLS